MERKKKIRIAASASSIALLVTLIYLAFVPNPVRVDSLTVQRGTFKNVIKVDGILRSKNRHVVTAFGEGDIKRVGLKVGDRVKKGESIVELLWGSKYLPVKSPIDGVISRVFRESAGPIRRGDPIVEVVDPNNLEIVAELLTTDAVLVDIGDEVLGQGWGREEVIKGKVVRISKAGFIKQSALGVDEEKTEVIADITQIDPSVLKRIGSNYHLDVSIEVEKVENALKIPIGAIYRVGKSWAVYKIIDGKAVETIIEFKSKGSDEILIEQGLSEGDKIINFPGDLVKDGVRVR